MTEPLVDIFERYNFRRVAAKCREPCPQCASAPDRFNVDAAQLHAGGHWGKVTCGECGAYIAWLGKPEGEASKYHRPPSHRRLVKKFSRGFCELCLRKESEVPAPQTLEAQHVVEYADGGTDERENIWIICTSCHRLIHWQRTYLGHYHQQGEEPAA